MAIVILAAFTGLFLFGVRESSGVTLSICIFHCMTMFTLIVACVIHWVRDGNGVISENWKTGPSGSSGIARAIFNGICIGLLGVTGFESAPA
jgi:amino acid transporter